MGKGRRISWIRKTYRIRDRVSSLVLSVLETGPCRHSFCYVFITYLFIMFISMYDPPLSHPGDYVFLAPPPLPLPRSKPLPRSFWRVSPLDVLLFLDQCPFRFLLTMVVSLPLHPYGSPSLLEPHKVVDCPSILRPYHPFPFPPCPPPTPVPANVT